MSVATHIKMEEITMNFAEWDINIVAGEIGMGYFSIFNLKKIIF
jgi:hypothetical protein